MKRILCYGDSLTWGFIPGDGRRFDENKRWTKLLQKKLNNKYEIIENGVNGRTTVYETRSFEQNGSNGIGIALCSSYPLDIVVVMLGSNDIEFVSAESVGVGMDELLRRIKGANSIYRTPTPIFTHEPKVLIVSPPFILDNIAEINPFSSCINKTNEMKKLPKIYENVAKNNNCYFLDANQFVKASSKDCVHMDAKNHAIFAEAIYKKIIEIEKIKRI